MSDAKKETFVRWQSVTQKHFSSVVNLVLGLSTGLLAFQANLLIENSSINLRSQQIIVFSIISLCISLLSALFCALNRLTDSRKTAQIARKKMNGDSEGLEELREEVKIIGNRTWKCLEAQLIFFALGTLLLAAAIIIYICHKS